LSSVISMENNEPELGQEERIKLMSAALASPPVQQMLSKWEGEKTLLRKQAIEFWKAFDKEFEDFWNKISVDIRSAFIMTAIEDLVDGGGVEPLIICCCPEILSEDMIANPKKIVDLFAVVASGKENFPKANSTSADDGASIISSLEQSPEVEKSLKLCRSNLLLQFCVAIQLVFTEEKNSLS
jgi:hypothetical protein